MFAESGLRIVCFFAVGNCFLAVGGSFRYFPGFVEHGFEAVVVVDAVGVVVELAVIAVYYCTRFHGYYCSCPCLMHFLFLLTAENVLERCGDEYIGLILGFFPVVLIDTLVVCIAA